MTKSKFSWNEYFSGSPTTTLNSTEYNSQRSYSSGNIYVLNCLFNRFTSGSNGGALCCTSVTYLLVESSSFFSCKTSSYYGGAIYFENTNNGQCVLYGVCGNDCCSTYTGSSSPHGQFVFTKVNDDASSKNYVNYSSITRCIAVNPHTYCTVYLCYGKIYCPSVNSSMNKCHYFSGIWYYSFSDSNSVICSYTYSTFADNNALTYICVSLRREGAKHEMKCCNILRNIQVSSSYGIIYGPGNWKIEDSCILENTATYIFYVISSTLTLSNCTVDKTTNNGYLTIQNTVTKSFILGLNHMSTQNCNSEYDSAGTLTAAPYVSHSTKILFCYTCKINKARISDLVSLIWLITQ
jgi:hypothetical protein